MSDALVRGGDEILLAFTRALRAAGVNVTQDRSQGFLEAASLLDLGDERSTWVAGRSTLCGGPDDLDRFDAVFEAFFNARDGLPRTRPTAARPARHVLRCRRPSATATAAGDEDTEVVRASASDAEVLRHRDVGVADAGREGAAGRDVRDHPPAPADAAYGPSPGAGTAARSTPTARCARACAGWASRRGSSWRRRGIKPRRVVLLVDVSGSMTSYADALLRLAHRLTVSLRAQGGVVETFTVGTRLTHLTRALRQRDAERALVAAGDTVPDWSGGTRLGETLRIFVDRWGQRGMARGSVVVVFSDGWERGDPSLLAEQMARLHRIAHRVVWVNPHRGKAGYEARAAGRAGGAAARRRLRRRPLAGDVRRPGGGDLPCVRCCPSCWPGGRRARRSASARSWRRSSRRRARPAPRCWSAPTSPRSARSRAAASRARSTSSGSPWSSPGEPVLQRYGISDDDAFAVGLTCGGILDVYVEKVSRETFPELGEIAADIEAGRPVALATVIEHPDPAVLGRRIVVRPGRAADVGISLGSSRMDDAVHDDAIGLLASGTNATLTYGPDGERRGEGMRVFVWAFAPKPRMLVFGAIDFAAAVARVGAFLGYHVTVCDARPVFATNSRFPEADEVVVDWPHRYLQAEQDAGRVDQRTVIAVLTHDPKFDVPLLEVALRLPEVAYVGAMGSRRTHDDRLARLHEAGPDREGDRPAVQPDRPRPRRAHARGDGDLDRRRDRGAAVGRYGRPAGRPGRPHPPLIGGALSARGEQPARRRPAAIGLDRRRSPSAEVQDAPHREPGRRRRSPRSGRPLPAWCASTRTATRPTSTRAAGPRKSPGRAARLDAGTPTHLGAARTTNQIGEHPAASGADESPGADTASAPTATPRPPSATSTGWASGAV